MDPRNASCLLNLGHLKNMHSKLEMEVAEHHLLINHLQSKLNSVQADREALLSCYLHEFHDVNYNLKFESEKTKNLSMKKQALEKGLKDLKDNADVQHSKIASLKEDYEHLKEEWERKGRSWNWVGTSLGVGIITVLATMAFATRRR